MIVCEKHGQQIHIFLTDTGKKKAKYYQINDLEIAKPKHWDGLWRILLFDIPEHIRIKREALRGKLIELGFRQLQKSAWVHAYDCKEELKLLREFFGLEQDNYVVLESKTIGPHEKEYRVWFQV